MVGEGVVSQEHLSHPLLLQLVPTRNHFLRIQQMKLDEPSTRMNLSNLKFELVNSILSLFSLLLPFYSS